MFQATYEGVPAAQSGLYGTKVTAEGKVVAVTADEALERDGYRPGLPALRSMQKQWNWMDFMDLQKALTFTVKRQEQATCAKVTLDTAAAFDFQAAAAELAWTVPRMAWMFGRHTSDGGVKVAALYEPPQNLTEGPWQLAEDPAADAVSLVAGLLGLSKVGMMYCHGPRADEGYVVSGTELLEMATAQAGASEEEERWATVRVSPNAEGHTEMDAYQVSTLCLDMMKAEALGPSPDDKPGECSTNPKYDVMVEAKAVPSVPTDFFLTLVPIAQYKSGLSAAFPKASRRHTAVTKDDFAAYLREAKGKSMVLVQALADFNLLVWMANDPFLQSCVPAVTQAILSGQADLEEGHKLMISGYTGVEY